MISAADLATEIQAQIAERIRIGTYKPDSSLVVVIPSSERNIMREAAYALEQTGVLVYWYVIRPQDMVGTWPQGTRFYLDYTVLEQCFYHKTDKKEEKT